MSYVEAKRAGGECAKLQTAVHSGYVIVTRLGAVRIAALSGAAAHVPVLCDPCACVRPFVPCVPRLPTVTFYRFLVEVQKGMSSVPVEFVPATTNTALSPALVGAQLSRGAVENRVPCVH